MDDRSKFPQQHTNSDCADHSRVPTTPLHLSTLRWFQNIASLLATRKTSKQRIQMSASTDGKGTSKRCLCTIDIATPLKIQTRHMLWWLIFKFARPPPIAIGPCRWPAWPLSNYQLRRILFKQSRTIWSPLARSFGSTFHILHIIVTNCELEPAMPHLAADASNGVNNNFTTV